MLSIAGRKLYPELIVFDKDGTLIAFEDLWHTWFGRVMAEIEKRVSVSDDARRAFASTLGYEVDGGAWDPLGPLSLASTGEVALLLAGQVYAQTPRTWSEALTIVSQAEEVAQTTLTDANLLEPIGPVAELFQRLRDEGILLAIATADNRESTEHHLGILGVGDLVAAVVCGDDGIAQKPAPDMALEVCYKLNVDPENAMMIGDTVADLDMAHRAGFSCAVAVASGAMPGALLAPHADLLIPDIHAIRIETITETPRW